MGRKFPQWAQNEGTQTLVNSRSLGPWAPKKGHRAKKNAIGLKKGLIGPNGPLLEVRFLEKIVLISTETLYIVLVYIHTDLSPVALYTCFIRLELCL